MLSPQDIFRGEGFPEAGIVFGGVLFPKLRSSQGAFYTCIPTQVKGAVLVPQIFLPLCYTGSSKCSLCEWMEMG